MQYMYEQEPIFLPFIWYEEFTVQEYFLQLCHFLVALPFGYPDKTFFFNDKQVTYKFVTSQKS